MYLLGHLGIPGDGTGTTEGELFGVREGVVSLSSTMEFTLLIGIRCLGGSGQSLTPYP